MAPTPRGRPSRVQGSLLVPPGPEAVGSCSWTPSSQDPQPEVPKLARGSRLIWLLSTGCGPRGWVWALLEALRTVGLAAPALPFPGDQIPPVPRTPGHIRPSVGTSWGSCGARSPARPPWEPKLGQVPKDGGGEGACWRPILCVREDSRARRPGAPPDRLPSVLSLLSPSPVPPTPRGCPV